MNMVSRTTILLCILGNCLLAQSVVGKWQTIDDQTLEIKSVVEIGMRDGKLVGKVIKLYPKPEENPDPSCTKCDPSDSRHQQKIIGMEILKDMKKDGQSYVGGEILDPEIGKTYRCKIWLEGDELKVRGYWGPFFRTQTWKRVR
jgi:uncharacterized protein (DUF2147 family)